MNVRKSSFLSVLGSVQMHQHETKCEWTLAGKEQDCKHGSYVSPGLRLTFQADIKDLSYTF